MHSVEAPSGCQPLQTIFSLGPKNEQDPQSPRAWRPQQRAEADAELPRSESGRGGSFGRSSVEEAARADLRDSLLTPPTQSLRLSGHSTAFSNTRQTCGSPRRRRNRGDLDVTSDTGDDLNRFRWKRGKPLGHGGFGRVFLGLVEGGGAGGGEGRLIAVKNVMVANGSDTEGSAADAGAIDALKNEVELMSKLQHKNIVQYIGMEEKEEGGRRCINIFMEYVPGGSLLSLLEEFGSFTDEISSSYTRQILEGLIYLHDNGVVHRDIKGANILINTEGDLRLADFGAAVQLEKLKGRAGTGQIGGTLLWMPPEVILEGASRAQDQSQDIWSLGCTVLEMLTAKAPFRWVSDRDIEVLEDVADLDRPVSLPPGVALSDCAGVFLRSCLRKEPSERPSAQKLLELGYIKLADSNPVTVKDKLDREQQDTGRVSSPRARRRTEVQSPLKNRNGSARYGTPVAGSIPSPMSSELTDGRRSEEVDKTSSRSDVRKPLRHPGLHASASLGKISSGRSKPESPDRKSFRRSVGASGKPLSFSADSSAHTVQYTTDTEHGLGLQLASHTMVLSSVAQYSPAWDAGAHNWIGHRLMRVNGKDVRCSEDVHGALQGREVSLQFLGFRQEQELEVLRSSGRWVRCWLWRIELSRVAVEVPRNEELEAAVGVTLEGARVVGVVQDGPASLAGVRDRERDGWRVAEVCGTLVDASSDLKAIVQESTSDNMIVRFRMVGEAGSGKYVVCGAEKPTKVKFSSVKPGMNVRMVPSSLQGTGRPHFGVVQSKTDDAVVMKWQQSSDAVPRITSESDEWWDGDGRPTMEVAFEKDISLDSSDWYLRRVKIPRRVAAVACIAAAVCCSEARPPSRAPTPPPPPPDGVARSPKRHFVEEASGMLPLSLDAGQQSAEHGGGSSRVTIIELETSRNSPTAETPLDRSPGTRRLQERVGKKHRSLSLVQEDSDCALSKRTPTEAEALAVKHAQRNAISMEDPTNVWVSPTMPASLSASPVSPMCRTRFTSGLLSSRPQSTPQSAQSSPLVYGSPGAPAAAASSPLLSGRLQLDALVTPGPSSDSLARSEPVRNTSSSQLSPQVLDSIAGSAPASATTDRDAEIVRSVVEVVAAAEKEVRTRRATWHGPAAAAAPPVLPRRRSETFQAPIRQPHAPQPVMQGPSGSQTPLSAVTLSLSVLATPQEQPAVPTVSLGGPHRASNVTLTNVEPELVSSDASSVNSLEEAVEPIDKSQGQASDQDCAEAAAKLAPELHPDLVARQSSVASTAPVEPKSEAAEGQSGKLEALRRQSSEGRCMPTPLKAPQSSSLRRPGGTPPLKTVSFDISAIESSARSSSSGMFGRLEAAFVPWRVQVLAGVLATLREMEHNNQREAPAERSRTVANLNATMRAALAGPGGDQLLPIAQPRGWSAAEVCFKPELTGDSVEQLIRDIASSWKVSQFFMKMVLVRSGQQHGLSVKPPADVTGDGLELLEIVGAAGPAAAAGLTAGMRILSVNGAPGGPAAASYLASLSDPRADTVRGVRKVFISYLPPQHSSTPPPTSPVGGSPELMQEPTSPDVCSPLSTEPLRSMANAEDGEEKRGGAPSQGKVLWRTHPLQWLIRRVKKKSQPTNLIIVVLACVFIVLLSVLVSYLLLLLLLAVMVFFLI